MKASDVHGAKASAGAGAGCWNHPEPLSPRGLFRAGHPGGLVKPCPPAGLRNIAGRSQVPPFHTCFTEDVYIPQSNWLYRMDSALVQQSWNAVLWVSAAQVHC